MQQSCDTNVLTEELKATLSELVAENKGKPGAIMTVLHEVQDSLGYIPYEVQKFLAEGLDVPLADIYGVITFYSRFSLTPTGKYKIGVCMGTACYVKSADKILERIEQILGIKAGETTEDRLFSIEATRCIGACGLAPVLTINEDVYGKLTGPDEMDGILAKYQE